MLEEMQPELAIQAWMRDDEKKKEACIEELKHKYAIKVRTHKVYTNLHLFKYDLKKSPLHEKIVHECRGIVLDEADNWRAVAYPFDKFFNYNETFAATIQWDKAKVQEKWDGSIMTIYYYKGEWQVASSGLPDAAGTLFKSDPPKLFSDLFWEIWKHHGYMLPKEDTYKEYCFMFEMCTPDHIINVQYEKSHMILLGVRHLATYKEHHPEPFAKKMGWDVIESFTVRDIAKNKNIDDHQDHIAVLQQAANGQAPTKHEGFVIVDASWNRIKLKNVSYVSMSHLSLRADQHESGFLYNCRCLLNIARFNEGSEFLGYLPAYEKRYFKMKCFYDEFVDKLLALVQQKKAYVQDQQPTTKKIRQYVTKSIQQQFGIQQFTTENKFINDVVLGVEDEVDIRQYLTTIDIKRLEKFIRYPAFQKPPRTALKKKRKQKK